MHFTCILNDWSVKGWSNKKVRALRACLRAQMFKLWCLAEGDLLREGNTYRLVNTGQASARSLQNACHSEPLQQPCSDSWLHCVRLKADGPLNETVQVTTFSQGPRG
jgi:hypothetical protein